MDATVSSKKFRSRTGVPVRLALLSGHVAIVDGEWQSLPLIFHESAYASGCVSEDMIANASLKEGIDTGVLNQLQKTANLKDKVKSAIEDAIVSNDLKAFNSKGDPTHAYIKKSVDEPVPAHLREAVWSEMLEEGFNAPADKTVEELNNDIT